MSNLVERFSDWSGKNGTHLNRHISIIGRQASNLKSYIDLFQKYPANSIEFKVEVEKLLDGIRDLSDEMRELTVLFAEDCDDFHGLLGELKDECMKAVVRNEEK